ncbi:MAG: carbamoyltransferase HypF [Proteobacteria bacterium]|nr:carbamoyltransferase HypF [Pseudomonadota bacterium]MBU1688753.1 carbamoyltransferase HypF [Pseudomonadota bacterium]
MTTIRKEIKVNGIVQGVGFRPFIFQTAGRLGLTGFVANTEAGVEIEVEGRPENVASLQVELEHHPPLLARISAISSRDIPLKNDREFSFHTSTAAGHPVTGIAPDAAICQECLQELLDPSDRRYHYPFINCINCGPRYTIVERIPYDRATTTMRNFTMCGECQREYLDPSGRRFHAQPNCCPACGPRLSLLDGKGRVIDDQDPLPRTIALLKKGNIVAIKGIGGFHLAVDAKSPKAVRLLRQKKGREERPFAMMAANLTLARRICHLSRRDQQTLQSPISPIVLALQRGNHDLAPEVAPGCDTFGIMLPYTPLHHLLFQGEHPLEVLVMTSGNRSEEPISQDTDSALADLAGFTDYFLTHDRKIHLCNDDSIVTNLGGAERIFRRSRGYAPQPFSLGDKGPPLLAVGGELKNTVCLVSEDRAIMSQHIGDLKNLAAYLSFQKTITHLRRIFEINPQLIVHDLHPGYLSSSWALEQNDIPTLAVQHHHAHLAGCLWENGHTDEAIGIILDGTGYGPDHTIWGGEILIGNQAGFRRFGCFEPMPLPGGDAAIMAPWRTAVAWLDRTFPENLPDLPFLKGHDPQPIIEMARAGINTPQTSSCGRLFDAVAAMAGGRQTISYEGQAAIEFMQAANNRTAPPYDYEITSTTAIRHLSVQSILRSVIKGISGGESTVTVSRRFHGTLIESLSALANLARQETGLTTVALSGGVLQNRLLLTGLRTHLKKHGFTVLCHTLVPCNDGGIALGQAMIGREYLKRTNSMNQ